MSQMTDETVDAVILGFLPPTDGMTFNGIVKRFREEGDGAVDKDAAENLVRASLKRMEKDKKARSVDYGPNNPMLYYKLIPWIIEDWTGAHKFPDKVFETFEDGVSFIAEQFPDDEEAQAEFYVMPKDGEGTGE